MILDTVFPLLSPDIPQHIAIVMDGNGRWAKNKGLERLKGHYQGLEALKLTLQGCHELGIAYLTVFAFSTENWNRPLKEVNGLMKLFKNHLDSALLEMNKNNIRLRFIGNFDRLDSDLISLMKRAQTETENNTQLHFTVAFNYGGRAEIVRAAQKLAFKVYQGELMPQDITEACFAQELFTYDLPDPDLLIRTGNESRISNYLLWQMAYTELVILETFWPDFKKEDLVHAIAEYQKRERRFGRTCAESY